jgi:hypothetical protein
LTQDPKPIESARQVQRVRAVSLCGADNLFGSSACVEPNVISSCTVSSKTVERDVSKRDQDAVPDAQDSRTRRD